LWVARSGDPFSPPIHHGQWLCWPVSPRVGNVKNNAPSVIEPAILHLRNAMRTAAAGDTLGALPRIARDRTNA
jgi:hypothetical protein